MEVIMPIGIPGSGKTRLYKMKYSHLTLLSKDLINKEMTGSINDWSRLDDLRNEINKRVDELIERHESFFYDATNLNAKYRKLFADKFKGTDIKVTYVVLPADVIVSMKRIEADLKNNVERSTTNYLTLFAYFSIYKQTLESKFEGENVQEIIYLKPEDLN